MFKRKFLILIIALTAILSLTFGGVTAYGNDTPSAVEVFSNSKIQTLNLQHEGGLVSGENYLQYLNATLPGLEASKSFSDDEKLTYANDIEFLLQYYKLASAEKLNFLYNANDYSQTENGTIAINNLKSATVNAINSASTYEEVDLAVIDFKNLIETGNFSKKSAIAVSGSEGVSGSVTAYKQNGNSFVETLVFSNDAIFSVTDVNDGVLIKNTQVALLNNDDVIENGGVFKYLNLKVIENGVEDHEVYEKLVVSINIQSLGLEVADGEVIQIAKYLKNQTVELITANVVGEYLQFEVTALGKYAVVKEGYAIESESQFLVLLEKYGLYAGIGLGVLLLIIIIIKASKSAKKRREKKEFKEFKKSKKASSKTNTEKTANVSSRKR